MPLYLYECERCGERFSQFHRECKKRVDCEECKAKNAAYWLMTPIRIASSHVGKPIESDALACHPSQIPEKKRAAAKRGLEVDFKPDGTALFTSWSAKRKYAEANGHWFKDAGYAEKTP